MLLNSVNQTLLQVKEIIETIQKLPPKNKAHMYCELNIGNHIRHINDHFLAVKQGITSGTIDYNLRNRGSKIETDAHVALNVLDELQDWVNSIDVKQLDSNIQVFSEVNSVQTESLEFKSSLAREFLYLINHTIHHTAHVGLIARNQGINIPIDSGLAPCTRTFMRNN